MPIKPESRVMVGFWIAYIAVVSATLGWYFGLFNDIPFFK